MMQSRVLQLQPSPVLDTQLRLLLGNMGTGVLPAIAFTALLTWRMVPTVPLAPALLWWTAAIVSPLVSWLHARYHLRRGWHASRAPNIVMQLVIINALDGCIWGALVWLCFGAHDGELQVIAAATLTGIAAHNLGQMAAIPQVFLAFLYAEIMAGDMFLLMAPDTTTRILGIGGLLLAPTFTLQVFNSAKMIRNAIELSIEKDALVQITDKAREAAVLASRSKSVFLAAASHDLRQPIHAQALFLEALSATSLDNAQRELLANARIAASASSDLLDALLDFSRLEAGVVTPAKREFPIQELFFSIENEAAPLAEAKGLVFRCRETKLSTYSDPTLVELIVRNLISNAIKYTGSGGVLLAARRKGPSVFLEVWDTGVGIDPRNHQAIFEEFHQLHNPERDRRKGLGLGLAIAKGLAERLGHTLTLGSQPGRGSVFRLELPLHLGQLDVVSRSERAIDALFTGKRALVLDDDELALHGMGSLLHSWEMVCDLCQSLDEALARASQHGPDVIISDFRLAEVSNGATAIAQVRATIQKNIPALLVTGDTSAQRLREAAATGIPLLHKPATPEQLRRWLANALG